MKENLEFARELAPVIHQWLEKETGVEYTLPKMGEARFSNKKFIVLNWNYDKCISK